MFPDEQTAENWFEENRWGKAGQPICCPMCDSNTRIKETENRKPLPYWCGACRRHFNVKTNTIIHRSRIPLRKWVMAIYLWSTSLKGVFSMKLYRDLKISQKSAWFLAHRLREAWKQGNFNMESHVEVDETFIGGKRKNLPNSKRKEMTGGGAVGKTTIAGARDRKNNKTSAKMVAGTDKETLQVFISERVSPDADVYTDDHKSYQKLSYKHKVVKHSVSQYVNGQAHTNGIESFWSLLKKVYHGTFNHFSPKHLDRYVNEFVTRHNVRKQDTIVMMGDTVRLMQGKRLIYRQLINKEG